MSAGVGSADGLTGRRLALAWRAGLARAYVERVLLECGGRVEIAAVVLGVGRSTLHRWCVEGGLARGVGVRGERVRG